MAKTTLTLSNVFDSYEVKNHMAGLVISPSYMKEAERCELKGALTQISGGKGIDPAHGHFGDAFGLACAHIEIRYRHEGEEELLGRAFLLAATKFGFLEAIKEKTRKTLIQSILLFYQLWHTKYAPEGWVGLASETRIVLDVDGIKFGGAYDLLALHTPSGMCRIFDFKAVESEFMYKWETQKQILHYTLLHYIHARHLAGKDIHAPLPDGQGCYFVALINTEGVVLYEREPHLGLYRQLRPYVLDALQKGEALLLSKYGDYESFTVAPGGWACSGRTQCKFKKACYENGAVDVKLHVDERVFDSPITYSMTKNDLMYLVDALVRHLDMNRSAWEDRAELATVAKASLYDVGDDEATEVASLIDTVEDADGIRNLLRD